MPKKTIYIDADMAAQLTELAPLYAHNESRAIREAVARLYEWHFPEAAESYPPHVVGYDRIRLAQPVTCDETGEALPAGTDAWREVWSDRRPGRILSERGLDAALV